MEIVKGILMCIGAGCVVSVAVLGVIVAGVTREHEEPVRGSEYENWEDQE